MILEDTYNRRASDFKEAQRLVGELNSKRDSETLDKKTEQQTLSTKDDLRVDPAKARSKGLLRTFREIMLKYANKEADLPELLGECEINGIPREYAQKLITELVESGQAYRPGKDKIAFL
jgi:hypothetical protein